MGGPKKNPGNFVGDTAAAVSRGLNDIGKSTSQITSGQAVDKGLSNFISGTTNVASLGVSEKAGLIKGETLKEMKAAEEVANEQQAVKDQAVATEDARLKAIQTSIEEQVNTRLRTPGRSQTLLGSSGLNPTGNNTLLTMGNRKR